MSTANSAALQEMLHKLADQPPEACAQFTGSKKYPEIRGKIDFYSLWGGTVAFISVYHLPVTEKGACNPAFHGLHIHEGASCKETQNESAPFALTGNHYNPGNCPHPEHAGDLPPLMSNDGFAMEIFYTNHFLPEEIIGRTVIIHSMADDFTTQPSGNSGEKIACGEVKSTAGD